LIELFVTFSIVIDLAVIVFNAETEGISAGAHSSPVQRVSVTSTLETDDDSLPTREAERQDG